MLHPARRELPKPSSRAQHFVVAQEGLVLKVMGDSRVCAEWAERVWHILSVLGSRIMSSASSYHAASLGITPPSADGHGERSE